MTRKLTPYQRIVRNAEKGLGVVLSAEEVFQMSHDNAIERRAEVDDMSDEEREDDERAWRDAGVALKRLTRLDL